MAYDVTVILDDRPGELARLGEVAGAAGAAVGWAIDHFVKVTAPWGLIIGLLGGACLSIFVAVRGAARAQKDALAKAGPLPSVPDDEDED